MSDKMKSSELRKLVRMFNKRSKITIPKGLKGQGEMIKFLEKHGTINHENKVFLPNTQDMGKQIRLADYDKMFPPKTEAQKAEAKKKASDRKGASEMNMVKTLEGKGYKITKPKSAEKKPTPAPKKPVKKAPAKKAKADQFKLDNEALEKAKTRKKEAIQKKVKEAQASGKVSDADFMKRPGFKWILKKQTELYNEIIKLNKQRISGSLDEDKMDDMIDKLFDKINSETSKELNTKINEDSMVFKFGRGTARTDELIKKKLKKKMDEANTLKKKPAKKKASAPKKKTNFLPKQTFKEIVANLKKRTTDTATDEDGDRIYSDNTLKTLKEIFAIYKTLPYKLHKDEELYDLIDDIAGYRGDEASKYNTFLNQMKSYAKKKKN
jgi:hypothetical protein